MVTEEATSPERMMVAQQAADPQAIAKEPKVVVERAVVESASTRLAMWHWIPLQDGAIASLD